MNDKTSLFQSLRQPAAAQSQLIRTKLSIRFVKLAIQLQQLFGDSSRHEMRNYWTWRETQKAKQIMQSVVVWEDQKAFERCRFCGVKFSFFNPKHHCRICGLCMCGDLERECSLEVPLNLLCEKMEVEYDELKNVNSAFPLRCCTECRFVLLSNLSYKQDISKEPLIITLHAQITRIMREIEGLVSQTDQPIQRRLLLLCSKWDKLVKRLRSMKFEYREDVRLQMQMLEKCRLFWETKVLPLQQLLQKMHPVEERMNKHEVAKLQEQLIVLQEQEFLLGKQVEESKKKRHFDALAPMQQSLKEIGKEIKALEAKLGGA